jgi:hypothetical protein
MDRTVSLRVELAGLGKNSSSFITYVYLIRRCQWDLNLAGK